MYAGYDRLLRRLSPGLARSSLVLLVNWVHQGFLSLGKTDRIGKILIEGLLAAAAFLVLAAATTLPLISTTLLSLGIAHTGNWILNSNVHAARRAGGRFRTSKDRLTTELERLVGRLMHARVAGALLGGSGLQGGWDSTSDLDVHVVRRLGPWGALAGVWAVLKERSRAFFARFPLDIYLEDPVGGRWTSVATSTKVIAGDRTFLRSLAHTARNSSESSANGGAP